jgi:hypothetical protein
MSGILKTGMEAYGKILMNPKTLNSTDGKELPQVLGVS